MKTNEQNQAFKEATIAQMQRDILPLEISVKVYHRFVAKFTTQLVA